MMEAYFTLLVLFSTIFLWNPVAPQSMILIGGELTKDNNIIWDKLVELSGGPGSRIGIFTMAADNPAKEGSTYTTILTGYGADPVWIPVVQDNNSASASDPANIALIRQCTGFFFGGGVRARVLRALRRNDVDSPAMTALREVLRAGAVIAGTSAGMATQGGKVTVLTGETYPSLVYKNYSINENGGLGNFPGPYVLESHNSEQGREGRVIRILFDMKDLPGIGVATGFGIDEDHALVVTDLYNRPKGTVIGRPKLATNGVHFYDVSDVVSAPSATSDLSGARMSFYSVDDTIDLTTGEAIIAPWKRLVIDGTETHPDALPSSDIFSALNPGEWRSTVARFLDNRKDINVTSYSSQQNPTFQVIHRQLLGNQQQLYETKLYRGVAEDGAVVYSWENVQVDLRGL